MKYIILIVIIISNLIFAQNKSFDYLTELENGYSKDSVNVSANFVNNWSEESKPILESSISGINKVIYTVFEHFYSSDLFRKGLDEQRSPTHSNIQLIQDKITFTVVDSIPQIENTIDFNKFYDMTDGLMQHTIYNFRPNIHLKNKITLYFNKFYRDLFKEFLFKRDKNRRHYIYYNFPIEVNDDDILSIPYFFNIYINKSCNSVLIDFCFIGEGKIALLKRVKDVWHISKIELVHTQ